MEQKEKQIVVSLAGTVIVIPLYAYYIYKNYIMPNPGIINDFSFWGKAFLAFIPIAIVLQIAVFIIFAIINHVVTKEEIEDKSDERDRLIELKSLRVSHWIFIFGFLCAMATQALAMQPWILFAVLISSGILSGVISEIVKIFLYRKGC